MWLIVLGALSLMIAVYGMRFPRLVELMKTHDRHQWRTLSSPARVAFSKSIGVYVWLLGRGYQHSASTEIREQGERYYTRAIVIKRLLLLGVAMVAAGYLWLLLTLG